MNLRFVVKLICFALLIPIFCCFLTFGKTQAALITVDFDGVATSGTLTGKAWSGYFTFYDTSFINTTAQWDTSLPGYETDLFMTIDGYGTWTETSASLYWISYGGDSTLDDWVLGGDDEAVHQMNLANGNSDWWMGTAGVTGSRYKDVDGGIGGQGIYLLQELGSPTWSIRPNAPVPEPATVALLGIGLVGLAGAEVRRRRKKKA